MEDSKGAEMSREHKVQKLMGKKDQLVELPEGILYAIISKLTFKEAVKTSSLSKAWQSVWTCHPHLLLDSKSLLFDWESIYENLVYSQGLSTPRPHMIKQFERRKFVERVDHIMNQRIMGPKIDSLTVRSNLGEDCASHLTKWIQYAVLKGVEKINLDLSECGGSIEDNLSSFRYERYAFCCTLLASSENECTIKCLQLTSCSLSPISWPNSLKSLVIVVLRDVRISDLEMKSFLLTCPSLERLTLDNCQDLVDIEVAVSGLRLKYLCIVKCYKLMTIKISAEDLVTLHYFGQWVKLFFKSVPRLTQMVLKFVGTGREEGVAYALSGLANDVPHLASLNLICLVSLKSQMFAENVHTFSNIRELVLFLPFHYDDELIWIGYILKAFPMLDTLSLNLFPSLSNYFTRLNIINRHLPETPHRHLTQLVIGGFNGYPHEVTLLKHLLENATEIKVLLIGQRKSLTKEILEWLHKVVSPTVDLRIRQD